MVTMVFVFHRRLQLCRYFATTVESCSNIKSWACGVPKVILRKLKRGVSFVAVLGKCSVEKLV